MQDHRTREQNLPPENVVLHCGVNLLCVQGRVLLAATPACTAHLHSPAKVAAVLKTPSATIFNKHQLDTIAALAEMIIPARPTFSGRKGGGR